MSGGHWADDERIRPDGSPTWTHGFRSADAWLAYEPVPVERAYALLSAERTTEPADSKEPRPRSPLDRIRHAWRRR